MEENKPILNQITDRWFKIIVVQSICVAIILLTILFVKFFFKNTYKELKNWYQNNLCSETKISEVTDNSGGEDLEV